MRNGSIRNYCISANKKDYVRISRDLRYSDNSTNTYSYLKDKLLMKPFVQDSLEKVIHLCKKNLVNANIHDYSIFLE